MGKENNVQKYLEELLTVSDIEKVSELELSINAENPFVLNNSGSRNAMTCQHLSQTLDLCDGEERIVQTGITHQLGQTTFSIKVEKDCIVEDIIVRYQDLVNKKEDYPEIVLVVRYLEVSREEHEYDVIVIPRIHMLHQTFGFEYKLNDKIMNNLRVGTRLYAGDILADSPAVRENGGYAYGLNNRIALISIPEVAEDGVVISESCAERFSYSYFEKRIIEFGKDKFPLNLYGDDDNYKGFPDIGDYIREDGVIVALRSHNQTYAGSLCSKEDLKHYDADFDEVIRGSHPGGKVILNGKERDNGKVIDIKCWYNTTSKNKGNLYKTTTEAANKYLDHTVQFYDMLDLSYKNIKKESSRYGSMAPSLTHQFSRRIVEAGVLKNMKTRHGITHKGNEKDIYTLEILIKYTVPARLGSKISCLHGGKGVVVEIRPDHLMPRDSNGPVDIIMDPRSIVSRMNLGRLAEIYISASARKARDMIRELLNTKGPKVAFNKLLEYLKLLGNEQATYYAKASEEEKEMILREIMEDELRIFMRVSNPKPVIHVANDIKNSEFVPVREKLKMNINGQEVETEDDILVGVLYNILLCKTPEDNLSVTSNPWVNHYGLPASPPPFAKHAFPYKNAPVRIFGETEIRVIGCYAGSLALAELKDRANNPKTFKNMYRNFLTANDGWFQDYIVDRNEVPIGGDVSRELYESILKSVGLGMEYVSDQESHFDTRSNTVTEVLK